MVLPADNWSIKEIRTEWDPLCLAKCRHTQAFVHKANQTSRVMITDNILVYKVLSPCVCARAGLEWQRCALVYFLVDDVGGGGALFTGRAISE